MNILRYALFIALINSCIGVSEARVFRCKGPDGALSFSNIACPGSGEQMSDRELNPTVVDGYDSAEGAKRIQNLKEARRAKERAMDGRTSEENVEARNRKGTPVFDTSQETDYDRAKSAAKQRQAELRNERAKLESN